MKVKLQENEGDLFHLNYWRLERVEERKKSETFGAEEAKDYEAVAEVNKVDIELTQILKEGRSVIPWELGFF